ncbi:antibiotic biosynthesis monooxygenase [Acinetobacter sp. ANC 4169]|uniref:putative quinol monooxygenase n=1 Tax=Acinetobacter sp. ANC 4169 TaxID=1977879 RepID=UPI000A354871|nr:putative quinol monooxygenase [Acinetobacter sp. ANC 4169]OTG70407.1 antibiotic biosynthesis monooxygenase [Acinetobacter sp. ANC 4169]
MLTIIADIQIRPGAKHRENVLNAFRKITATVLQEEGCHGYELLIDHQSNADYQTKLPDVITTLEHWESMEHLNAHLLTLHMQAYQQQVKDDVLDVKIRIMQKGLSA